MPRMAWGDLHWPQEDSLSRMNARASADDISSPDRIPDIGRNLSVLAGALPICGRQRLGNHIAENFRLPNTAGDIFVMTTPFHLHKAPRAIAHDMNQGLLACTPCSCNGFPKTRGATDRGSSLNPSTVPSTSGRRNMTCGIPMQTPDTTSL